MHSDSRAPDPVVLAVHMASFLRSHEKLELIRVVKSERFLCSLSIDDLSRLIRRPLRTKAWNPEDLLARAYKQRDWLLRSSVTVHCLADASYPPQLREI